MAERTIHLQQGGESVAHLGQILDYLYLPPLGEDPEEAVATVLDLVAGEVRVGPDASEETLALAREGMSMEGVFVHLHPAADPDQLGSIAPADLSSLDEEAQRTLAELIDGGFCLKPHPLHAREIEPDAHAVPEPG